MSGELAGVLWMDQVVADGDVLAPRPPLDGDTEVDVAVVGAGFTGLWTAFHLLRGFLSKALFDAGLYCRADDRGDPVIQLAPPLIMGPEQFDDIESRLRSVLTEAWNHL